MRYLAIVHSQVDRVATEDLTLGGQQIHAGDFLVMNLPAGNWDPEFVDNPDVLDGDRNTRGHLGFGYGVHQCIGANLARVEMQIAFATLARRVPGLRLAVGAGRTEIQRRIRHLRHEGATRHMVRRPTRGEVRHHYDVVKGRRRGRFRCLGRVRPGLSRATA